jgi:GntR family transcriptional regulator
VLKIVRLRSAGETPLAKLTNYLPESVGGFEASELEAYGLYELMRGRGIQLHSATQFVGARKATAAEARLIDESRGAVVEFGDHIYAASRYSFETHLLKP